MRLDSANTGRRRPRRCQHRHAGARLCLSAREIRDLQHENPLSHFSWRLLGVYARHCCNSHLRHPSLYGGRADQIFLERDDFSSNRHRALAHCQSRSPIARFAVAATTSRAGPRSVRSCELPGRCRCNQPGPNADARISIMARANAQGPDLLQTDQD